MKLSDYSVADDFGSAGYQICADELGSIVVGRDMEKLKCHGGVSGIAEKLCTSTTDGLSMDRGSLNRRQELFGINEFTKSEPRGFWLFVWEALQDMTFVILALCAFVSLIVGVATEWWPSGLHDGVAIILSIFLVVFVTAISNYRQSLQYRHLDKVQKQISVNVRRNGYRHEMSIHELLPGDIVHLVIGDQVPADGLFVSGFSVFIDESSLTGESEPVMITDDNPYLLSGTKVCDGFCTMLVTTVGMRTEWGKLMAILSDDADDETPLQAKLNGLTTALKVTTLTILAVWALFSLIVALATGGWRSVVLGIVLSISLVVFVTAISYYRHLGRQKELQIWELKTFKFLDTEELWTLTTNGVELNRLTAVKHERGSRVGRRKMKKLKWRGGVSGIAEMLCTSTTNGLPVDRGSLNLRQERSEIYMFTESQPCAFWMYVWQALKVTLEFLAGLTFVSLIGSLATGEWPSEDLDGHGLEIVLGILLVVMMEKFWMKGSSPSTLARIVNLVIACYPISFYAVGISAQAQPSDSALEGNYTLKNFSRNNDEHPPRMLSVKKNWVQGTTMLDWTDMIMFIGITLLVVTLYYHKGVLSAFCVLWIHIIDLMKALKIKMKQALVKLQENNIRYLGRVFKLSNIAIASPFLGGARKWKASVVVGIALFSIICYCAKVSVELKKSQVTAANFFSELRNNKKVLFFTARHALDIAVPLLFSLQAYVYLMELDRKYHHTEKDWLSFVFGLQVVIQVIGVLQVFMDDCNHDHFRHNDQNQLIPVQPVDTADGTSVSEMVPEVAEENVASVSVMVLEVAEELSEVVADVHL